MKKDFETFVLDPAFGKQGTVICDDNLLDGLIANSIYSIALRKDGTVVLAASDKDRDGGLLIALDKNGQPDGKREDGKRFARHIQLLFQGHVFEEGVGVQELADGRLLFTAWLEGEGEALWIPGFAVVHPDLTLDTTFGDNGFTVVPFLELGRARAPRTATRSVAPTVQGNRIIGTPTHFIIPFVVNDEQTFVIRLLANGKLDTEYFGRGYQEINYQGHACELPATTTLEDGRILLAGRCEAKNQTLIVALDPQGEIDPGFGDAGFAPVELAPAKLLSIFQTAEHKLLVSGFLGNLGLLASMKADGGLDPEFNNGAPLELPSSSARMRLERLETLLDGQIFGVGQDQRDLQESKGVLTCHDLRGVPHAAFGPHGTLFVDDSYGFWDLKLQNNGKLLVAGSDRPSRAGMVSRYHFIKP